MINAPLVELVNAVCEFPDVRPIPPLTFNVTRGEFVCLHGPTGSGKSLALRLVAGLMTPTSGKVLVAGELINDFTPRQRLWLRRTMGIMIQGGLLLEDRTVLENVMIGRHCRTSAGIAGAVFQDSRTKAEEQATIDRSYELLREVGLNMHYQDEARNLPYGAQRRLEIARALATDPAVLLLDEPAAGMNPQETLELKSLILHLRKEFDLSILLIEHDMGMVMSLSDRIYVMEYGSRIAMGTPQEVRENPRVIKAYLGESDHA